MYRATFELEAITPVFMRGADQGKAEFRPASVKGVMRWWFRALAGAYLGNNIEKLREVEGRIFGSAGGGKSRVIVEVSEGPQDKSRGDSNINNLLDDYTSYFWFSQVGRYQKGYLPSGRTFKVTLKSPNQNYLNLTVLSLWAALHLGGFGSRSRKFGGSLFPITEPTGDFDIGITFIPKDPESYYRRTIPTMLQDFGKNLRSILPKDGAEYLKILHRKDISGLLEYPAMIKDSFWVFVGSVYNTPAEAIHEAGRWYLGRRMGRKFDGGFRFKYADRRIPHRLKERGWTTERLNLPVNRERRPYLGLPIQFYKMFGTRDDNITVKFTVDHRNAKRRASGVIMTIKKTASGKYYPIITVFHYKFVPDYTGPVKYHGRIQIEREGKKKSQRIGGKLYLTPLNSNPNKVYDDFVTKTLINDLMNSGFRGVYP